MPIGRRTRWSTNHQGRWFGRWFGWCTRPIGRRIRYSTNQRAAGSVRLRRTDNSAVAEHAWDNQHQLDWDGVQCLSQERHWYTRRVKEAINIRLNPNNFNRDNGIDIPEFWMRILEHYILVPCDYDYIRLFLQGPRSRGARGLEGPPPPPPTALINVPSGLLLTLIDIKTSYFSKGKSVYIKCSPNLPDLLDLIYFYIALSTNVSKRFTIYYYPGHWIQCLPAHNVCTISTPWGAFQPGAQNCLTNNYILFQRKKDVQFRSKSAIIMLLSRHGGYKTQIYQRNDVIIFIIVLFYFYSNDVLHVTMKMEIVSHIDSGTCSRAKAGATLWT